MKNHRGVFNTGCQRSCNLVMAYERIWEYTGSLKQNLQRRMKQEDSSFSYKSPIARKVLNLTYISFKADCNKIFLYIYASYLIVMVHVRFLVSSDMS